MVGGCNVDKPRKHVNKVCDRQAPVRQMGQMTSLCSYNGSYERFGSFHEVHCDYQLVVPKLFFTFLF